MYIPILSNIHICFAVHKMDKYGTKKYDRKKRTCILYVYANNYFVFNNKIYNKKNESAQVTRQGQDKGKTRGRFYCLTKTQDKGTVPRQGDGSIVLLLSFETTKRQGDGSTVLLLSFETTTEPQ